MSKKGIDYSKWDKIEDSDEEDEPAKDSVQVQNANTLSKVNKDTLIKEHPELAAQAGLIEKTKENKDKKRKQYLHEGLTAAQFDIEIKSDHIMVGIKGNKERYLNHALWGRAKNSESFWTLEDGELHITLTKLDKAVPWEAALKDHQPLDPLTATEVAVQPVNLCET